MARRILDTGYLIHQWRRNAVAPLADKKPPDAAGWARELIEWHETNIIVTPIYIEFVSGTRSSHELLLARSFLAEFQVIDGGRILEADWKEAQRLAERIPWNSKPRQLGDCLVRAIARRLKCEVATLDLGFPS